MTKLTKEELDSLQEGLKEFNDKKMQLGETVMQQHVLLMQIADIRRTHKEQETDLINKYGKDSVINMEDGSIKQQDNG